MAKSPIDTFLAKFPPAQRDALGRVRDTIRTALPGAQEVLAWGMPSYRIDGDLVISFSGFAKHNSLFPSRLEVRDVLAKELSGYEQTKGTIHFDRDRPMPAALLKKILRTTIDAINDSYPRPNGAMKHFYANGFLQSTGRMKDGLLHGTWSWYRKDGSLMRTGAFRHGEKSGTWHTYTADGQQVT